MYETIKVEKKEDGKVAFVVLNRPERRNAISPKMTSELLQAERTK
jgi:enoyl-CoA hydratase/carnithine racemase